MQKYTIKYYDTKLFWEIFEVVSNKTYYIEEERKQKYYTHDSGARSFKKRELIFNKQALSYGSEKKSSVEENKKWKKSYTKPEKRSDFYEEVEKEVKHKENEHEEPFIYMAQRIQALEKKLSSFENKWGLEASNCF